MRQKRAKTYRKLMHSYCQSFGFRQPYQVLVDAETCRIADLHKIDIVKQLGIVLQGEVKLMITQCCIHELYLQGKSHQSATDLAKTFERRKCNHKEAIPGDDCLMSVVGDTNKHRYVITTQSHPLRVQLRTVLATPIVHIKRLVVVLEPPSDITLQAKAKAEKQLLHPTVLWQDSTLTSPSATGAPLKKRKGAKGPNPLSIKKKRLFVPDTEDKTTIKIGLKRKREEGTVEAATKKKRKRKHTKPSIEPETSFNQPA